MNEQSFSPELLTGCDREPIHIPGAVQPHGLMLVVESDGRLAAVAGDRGLVDAQSALDALTASSWPDFCNTLPSTGSAHVGTVSGSSGPLDAIAHRSNSRVVIELEPTDREGLSAAEALGAAHELASRLDGAAGIVDVCQVAADAVRGILGYDRIMIYRFLDDESGDVVAEAKSDSVDTLLHHRFPASDIPKQARLLYARNPIRVIPDISYTPAPVEWLLDEPPVDPVDMSDAHLRSVSPIHIEYLKNMGIGASASISIMVDDELWGLVACHHNSPRPVGYVHRQMAKHVGQLLGNMIGMRTRSSSQLEMVRLTQRRDELIHILTGVGNIEDALLRHPQELLRVIPSDGVAILSSKQLALYGSVPTEEQVRALLDDLAPPSGPSIVATHRLVDRAPIAEEFAEEASGALVAYVRRDPQLVIAWFRAEQVKTVDWAGNPHKPVNEESGILTPRKSFELWRDTVRCESERWTNGEIDAAERLRLQILEIVDQQELKRLNTSLRQTVGDKEDLIAQKDLLMREVNHRVQNSLQLVNSMLHIQEREAGESAVRSQFEVARQRLTAVAMVHRRLWRTDKLGDVRLDTFIAELIEEQVKIWGDAWRETIHLEVSPVVLPTDTAIVVGLILTELMTNAVKYAYGGETGPLIVEAKEVGRRTVKIAIGDRGVGFSTDSRTASFGTRLVDTLVKQLNGEIKVRDNNPGALVELHFPSPAA